MKEHLVRLDEVDDVLLLTGPKGRKYVVTTLENYSKMDETTFLLSSPKNRRRLMQSLEDYKAGRFIVKTMKELEAMTRESVQRAKARKTADAAKSSKSRESRKK